MTPEQEQKLNELYEFMQNMKNSTTIPFDVDGALRERFGNSDLSESNKSASAENRTVNESGSSTYSVLGPPDAFLQVIVSGTNYYIPVYT